MDHSADKTLCKIPELLLRVALRIFRRLPLLGPFIKTVKAKNKANFGKEPFYMNIVGNRGSRPHAKASPRPLIPLFLSKLTLATSIAAILGNA